MTIFYLLPLIQTLLTVSVLAAVYLLIVGTLLYYAVPTLGGNWADLRGKR